MTKTLSSLAKLYDLILAVVIFAIVFNPGTLQAKGGEDQNQIILLNDSAAALEDSNPGLSKSLTEFADEKEKEWEGKNANKPQLPPLVTGKYIKQQQGRVKLLKAAALAIRGTYPLIAKSLDQMAKDLNGSIKNDK